MSLGSWHFVVEFQLKPHSTGSGIYFPWSVSTVGSGQRSFIPAIHLQQKPWTTFAHSQWMFEGKSSKVLTGIAVLISSFFAYHVYYLAYIKFDYGYNMKANIAIGLLNALCWVIWGWRNRMTKLYVWKCNTFIILALASISLEVLDFAPILWTFDSHALWHFSTALITPLWYSFLIDDCYYLHETTKYKML